MIANGEAYVAQVYSWLSGSKHGEIYFKKADDGTTIDKSIEHRECDVHGHEHITQTDSTIVMPAAPHPVNEAARPTKNKFYKKCCICNESINGDSFNANPIKNGFCCNECYSKSILPTRQKYSSGNDLTKLREELFAIISPTEEVPVEAPVELTTDPIIENNGLATIVNTLIKDEFDAIQAYNDAIINFSAEGRTDLVQVLQDIVNEENLHVGQLEVVLEQVSGSANSIDQGKAEAETQLSGQPVVESLETDTNKQDFLKQMAQDDWDCGHTFDPDDFHEFKKICKECGFDVDNNDFNLYFEYIEDCRHKANNPNEDEDPEEGMHY